MISFHALGVCFRLPLLTLIFPFLARRLGMNGAMTGIAICLCLHEFAHVLAARLCGVEIQEITLMPFGGSARMVNPYQLPIYRLIPVAAAGPAANLLLAFIAAALSQWRLLDIKKAAAIIQPSLIMMVFNLFPALPLDGGRIAFALLSARLEEAHALNLCIWSGRILAGALALICAAGGLIGGRWNLSIILASVFLISSEKDERTALSTSRMQRISDAMKHSCGKALPVRFLQLSCETSVHAALRMLRPSERTWFILSRNGIPCSMLDDKSLLQHFINSGAPDASLGELKGYRLS